MSKDDIIWVSQRIAGLLYFFVIAIGYGFLTKDWGYIVFTFEVSGVAIGLFLLFALSILFYGNYIKRKHKRNNSGSD